MRPDDIVYFRPPPVLREVVSKAGGTLSGSDLFVKRVAALPGDQVTVTADGSVDVRSAKAGVKVQGTGGTTDGGNTSLGANKGAPGFGTTRGRERGAYTSRSHTRAPEEGSGSRGNDGGQAEGGVRAPLPASVLQRISRLDDKVLPPRTVFVLGDNPAASMDSRVWGELDEREIVGHALLRVLPPRSFGLLQ